MPSSFAASFLLNCVRVERGLDVRVLEVAQQRRKIHGQADVGRRMRRAIGRAVDGFARRLDGGNSARLGRQRMPSVFGAFSRGHARPIGPNAVCFSGRPAALQHRGPTDEKPTRGALVHVRTSARIRARAPVTAGAAPLRRLRVMTSGRWHPPAGAAAQAPRSSRSARRNRASARASSRANLAAAIAGLGRQVVLVDLDPRSPRQHALFGLELAGGRPGGVAGTEARPPRRAGARDERPQPAAAAEHRAGGARRCRGSGGARSCDELYDLDSDRRRRRHRQRQPRRPVRLLRDAARCGCWSRRASRAALEATYAFLKSAALRAERRHGDDAPARAGALLRRPGGQFDRHARRRGDVARVRAPGARSPGHPVARVRLRCGRASASRNRSSRGSR